MGLKSSKSKAAEPEESEKKQTPAEQFSDGTIVILTSKVSKKSLRIHEDSVDAQGEDGEEVQFTVHKKESESGLVVTLQSVANAEKYVQIREGAVEGCGTGDELSELKVADCSEGLVSLESAKTTGQFIAVNEDGSVQLATETGPSAHFTVSSPTASKDAQAEATPQAESDPKESDATPQAEADPKDSEAAPAQSESDPTPTSTQQPQSESEPSETAQQEQQEQDPGTTAEAEPASS